MDQQAHLDLIYKIKMNFSSGNALFKKKKNYNNGVRDIPSKMPRDGVPVKRVGSNKKGSQTMLI